MSEEETTFLAEFDSLAALHEVARCRIFPENYELWFGAPHDAVWTVNQRNESAFGALRLAPRIMRDTSTIDTTVTVLGAECSLPVILAPVGNHKRVHPDGELASARAAAASGTVLVVSHNSSCALEEVAHASAATLWMQIYPMKDRGIDQALATRAGASGYQAIVVTVDNSGYRTRERSALDASAKSDILALANHTAIPSATATIQSLAAFADAQRVDLSWEYVTWLKSVTPLPIVVKGLQTGSDAVMSVDAGADAIIVSNHGGHALADGRATISVLAEVTEAVEGRIPVILDGGVRTGTDVLKALSIGASATMIGRPLLWALSVGGCDAVVRMLEVLRSELRMTMGLCGQNSASGVPRELVAH